MPIYCDAQWTKAKETFKNLTKTKKPKEKVLLVFNNSHTGLSKSLKNCVEIFEKLEITREQLRGNKIDKPTQKDALKALEAFAKAKQAFKRAMDDYMPLLAAAIKEQKDLEADEKSLLERGLKFLKKELESYDSAMASKYAIEEQAIDKSLDNLTTQQKQEAAVLTNLKKVIDEALAGAAKMKLVAASAVGKERKILALSTKAYNDMIPENRGRNVAMQFVIAMKMPNWEIRPDQVNAAIEPWKDATHKLDVNKATAENIMEKVSDFNKVVKACKAWLEREITLAENRRV